MSPDWSFRIGILWLLVVVASAWVLGREASNEDASVVQVTAIVGSVAATMSLGAALVLERHWFVLVGAPALGGVVATLVFTAAVFSQPYSGDSYYPLVPFVAFSVVLGALSAIGGVVAAVWRVIAPASTRRRKLH